MLRVHLLRDLRPASGLLVVEIAVAFPAVKAVVALVVVLLQRAEALEIEVTVMDWLCLTSFSPVTCHFAMTG